MPAITGINPALVLQDPSNAKVVAYFDSAITNPSLAMQMVNQYLLVSWFS